MEPHGGPGTCHQRSTYPDAITFKALCGTDLVTSHPQIWEERNLGSPPNGPVASQRVQVRASEAKSTKWAADLSRPPDSGGSVIKFVTAKSKVGIKSLC